MTVGPDLFAAQYTEVVLWPTTSVYWATNRSGPTVIKLPQYTEQQTDQVYWGSLFVALSREYCPLIWHTCLADRENGMLIITCQDFKIPMTKYFWTWLSYIIKLTDRFYWHKKFGVTQRKLVIFLKSLTNFITKYGVHLAIHISRIYLDAIQHFFNVCDSDFHSWQGVLHIWWWSLSMT
jgi:hypothetical protein